MADVEKIRVYVVSSKEGPAKFERIYEVKVPAGESYKDIIDQMARKDEATKEPASDPAKSSREQDDCATASRDGLDIDLGKEDGPIAIAICLPNQLEFLDPPIIEQKTNAKTGEKFIKSEHRHVEGGNRWASFVCNMKEAKGGKLAKRIGALPNNPYGVHKHAMRVPFSYDIIDKGLDFATWVLPDHSHVKENDESDEKGKAAMMTHGGVHPYSSYFLTIDL